MAEQPTKQRTTNFKDYSGIQIYTSRPFQNEIRVMLEHRNSRFSVTLTQNQKMIKIFGPYSIANTMNP